MLEQGARLEHPEEVGAQAQPGVSRDAVPSRRGALDLISPVGSVGLGGSGAGQLGLRSRSRRHPVGAELARAASTTSERPGGRRAPGCLGASNRRVMQEAEKQQGKAKFNREKSLSSAPRSAGLQESRGGGLQPARGRASLGVERW